MDVYKTTVHPRISRFFGILSRKGRLTLAKNQPLSFCSVPNIVILSYGVNL
jgi:hypothetical protein